MRNWIGAGALALAVMTTPLPLAAQEAPAAQQAQPAADVPVRAVVLFSSGVGYFEHFGTVDGNATSELRFKTAQINDILKSLVLEDLDGGRVGTITYPSQDPIDKTLRSFQIDITGNPPLAALLNQLRGAQVTLVSVEGEISGTVLGVEPRRKPAGDDKTIEVPVLNLIAGGVIRSVELPDVRSLRLDDPQLHEELSKALQALAQARDQDKKPVVIDFAGDGRRRVRIGYVVETPVWKTSYRLILGDGDQPSKLQGWAIVENQTDNDWNNVQLSLVSGRPISFIQDLYQPLYIQRPVVEPELYTSLRPQRYKAGVGADVDNQPEQSRLRDARRESAQRLGRAMAAPTTLAPAGEADMAYDAPLNPSRSVASVASAADIGELFQYTVPNVTLARHKSAMLPIVTDEIETERISIYNPNVLAAHPLNGARVKNTTGKHLLAGPVTVFDASAYAGDAQIENLPPGQQRLLSYGIDLKMRVNATNQHRTSAIVTGRIVKGVLELTHKHVQQREYAIDNQADAARTLILEHPLTPNWKLVDSPEPIETTEQVYRFRLEIPAGQTQKQTINEQIINQQTIAILPLDISQIAIYARTDQIPQDVRQALQRAIELKQALVDTERQIEQAQQRLNEYPQQQDRIRRNMQTIDRNSDLYATLMERLRKQETEIVQLEEQLATLRTKRDQQRKALEDYLSNLTIGEGA